MAEKEKSIGALWAKEGKAGEYMTGQIDLEDGSKLRIVVFKNTFKKAENQPDYKIYKSRPRDDDKDIPF